MIPQTKHTRVIRFETLSVVRGQKKLLKPLTPTLSPHLELCRAPGGSDAFEGVGITYFVVYRADGVDGQQEMERK